ncbi:hypothetical protein B0H14DRAFT_2630236 [Mycena olivaceomarginata]|nr:hypothetical protein B0H14DRAFT_2630236 [Mycena olivaceomarginata]
MSLTATQRKKTGHTRHLSTQDVAYSHGCLDQSCDKYLEDLQVGLEETLHNAVYSITPEDAAGWFRHSGYILIQAEPDPELVSCSLDSSVPTFDTMIPSTGFSRMSLADIVNLNAMQDELREDTDSQVYDLYGVAEEDEERGEHSDTDTLTPGRQLETPMLHTRSTSCSARSATSLDSMLGGDPEAWHTQAAAAHAGGGSTRARGIHLCPSDFVGEMLVRVFGGVKEMTALPFMLAPPEHGEGQGQQQLVSMGVRPGSGWFERTQVAGVAASFDISLCGWMELTLRKHENQESYWVHRKTSRPVVIPA